jgi:acetyl-CoA C-acetyltransferase
VNEVFIYDAIRSARTKAKPDGGLAALSPMELVASLLNTLTERTNLDPKHVEDVTLGCVTQAVDQAANVAKTSLMVAGWPDHVPGITVNRFCSSGLDACNIAAMKVMAGQADLTIGGGVEMMSRVPMLSDKATAFHDQSFAIRNRFLLMGAGADFIATR